VRIALVSTPFVSVPPRGYGGTELIVGELQRGLIQSGHEVTLFATGDSEGPDVRYLYERSVWPPTLHAEVAHSRFVAQEIARGGYDVVHSHLSSVVDEARGLGAPLVHTIHHCHDTRLTRLYQSAPDVRYVAISRRQAAMERTLRCDVVHHGLRVDAFPEGHGRGGYALFLGRLAWCKAPDMAAEAARSAGVELVVAGALHDEPTDPPDWHERMQEMLSRGGVRHVGGVGGDRKLSIVGSAAALLMPLRWEEPFGLVMIEAMLCGTPVIAFRRGAAPEIVEDGVTGFLVDDVEGMADALGRVRELDRAACRRRARARFSASRMVRDYLAVYRAALTAQESPWGSETEDSRYAAH
jgi:glycosyltransferase involved in cell wall biosynthesis